MVFQDRHQAGQLMSDTLAGYRKGKAVVLGLPRGGVVVASALARALSLPLDVVVVKKIPSPGQPELGIGALAPDGVSYIDWKLAHRVAADEEYVKSQSIELTEQIKRKTLLYRKGRKPLDVREKTVIVVDDGAATGVTLEAAVKWLRSKKAKRIVVAIPVAPREVVARVKPEVDELIVLTAPGDFGAVGQFYKEFGQVEDEEVVKLLQSNK